METPGHKSDTGWPRVSPDDENTRLDTWRNWKGCQLDSGQCLSLEQILQSFSAPISEEHAWAVIHQVRSHNFVEKSFFIVPLFYYMELSIGRRQTVQCTAVFLLLNKYQVKSSMTSTDKNFIASKLTLPSSFYLILNYDNTDQL